jgi:ADP-ribose pyrophosphatase YjhB (NUDIX family)
MGLTRSLHLTEKFVVCVDGVYIDKEKILLLKRATEPFKGYWHVVGGQVENDETLRAALKREFKEETNLYVKIGNVIDGRIEKTFDRTKIIVVFEVTSARGEIRLNSESEAYGWFNKNPSNTICNYEKYLNNKATPTNPKTKLKVSATDKLHKS